MAKVRFENITYRYGTKVILEDFSLAVEESQIMGIVGPSGCGKTTLIRCLCGFIKPEKGEIYIEDTCVFSVKKRINIPPERRKIGVVFQDYAVWPHLTVYENIAYPMKKQKLPKAEIEKKAAHALEQVRMTGYEKHLPSQLSGGQQQRVAIARALVSSNDLIILDEPITNLDLKLREEMLYEIKSIQEKTGTTIIYITHDQEAALQLCDKIAIMDTNGKLSQIGTDEEIVQKPSNRFVFTFIGVSNFIPVTKKSDGLYFEIGQTVKYSDEIPKEIQSYKKIVMAIRPMDILFNDDVPIKGTVISATFLGNIYNYFVQLGNCKIRVQRNALDVLQSREYAEGETVGLEFVKPHFYEDDESIRKETFA